MLSHATVFSAFSLTLTFVPPPTTMMTTSHEAFAWIVETWRFCPRRHGSSLLMYGTTHNATPY